QGPDDFRHAAQENQQAAYRPAQGLAEGAGTTAAGGRRQRQRAAGEQGGRHRYQQRQGHAGGGDGQGLQGGGKQQVEELAIVLRWPEGGDEAAHLALAVGGQQHAQ